MIEYDSNKCAENGVEKDVEKPVSRDVKEVMSTLEDCIKIACSEPIYNDVRIPEELFPKGHRSVLKRLFLKHLTLALILQDRIDMALRESSQFNIIRSVKSGVNVGYHIAGTSPVLSDMIVKSNQPLSWVDIIFQERERILMGEYHDRN